MPHLTTADVENLAHVHMRDCYQCGKCSAGCPVAEHMDVLPSQLVRLVQLGRIEKAIGAEAIWQCVSCLTCSTRCPQEVDCAGVIDALRQLSIAAGAVAPARRRTLLFQQAFLDNVRRHGRLNELELVGMFKTKALAQDGSLPMFLKDALLAPKMLKRGKLRLTRQRSKDRGVVKRIFERCKAT